MNDFLDKRPKKFSLIQRRKMLKVLFDDGSCFNYEAEYLRTHSPDAMTKGHGTTQHNILPDCKHVTIKAIEPIGHQAIRIIFDDNHSAGIYSWQYLYELGDEKNERWTRYLKMLESLGLKR